MQKLNKKGFFLVETLIVVGIAASILVLFYKQISNLYNSYENNVNYDTVQAIHADNNIKKFIEQEGKTILITALGTNDYLDITNYAFTEANYYTQLKIASNINKIYFTKYNLNSVIASPSSTTFSASFIKYLKTLKLLDTTGSENKYRIIIRLDDGSYSNIVIDNKDAIKPVITLLGASSIDVYAGSTYTDAGATASDNIDGNITTNIVTTSNLNINEVGTYKITYNVVDSSGNAAVLVVRTINVIPVGYLASEGVNMPRLVTGMTAVKWSGSSWNTVTNPNTDTSWYNYTNKEWANAKTSDGSYWVWIPRYIYKISSGWHTATAGTIDVAFSMGTDDTRGGTISVDTGTTAESSNNKWTNHPAFTFGTTELTGIWVAKFEPSVSNTSDLCYTSESAANCDKTTLTLKSIPNVRSWRWITIGNAFTVSRNMETNNAYGWGTSGAGIDTHLMKNVEWGAIAYLSKSVYGKNTEEMWKNPNNTYLTGCAGDTIGAAGSSSCNAYETTNGVKASTTGTIYGIYDISGCTNERTAAYVTVGHETDNGASIVSAASKYKDIYTGAVGYVDNYNPSISEKGDAIYETSNGSWYNGTTWVGGSTASWYTEYSNMPYASSSSSSSPWITRGGYQGDTTGTGAFFFGYTAGHASVSQSFRPTLVIEVGL